MAAEDIQYLCNILGDLPELLAEFVGFLPHNRRFTLSQDFNHTRLVLVTQDEKVVERRASFGMIDTVIGRKEARSADTYIFNLLSSALQEEEREEAVSTLRGGDALCALLQIQQVRYLSFWINLY